jgi:hypothetical protein
LIKSVNSLAALRVWKLIWSASFIALRWSQNAATGPQTIPVSLSFRACVHALDSGSCRRHDRLPVAVESLARPREEAMRVPRLSARFWEMMESVGEEALRNDRETFGPKSVEYREMTKPRHELRKALKKQAEAA